MPMVIGPTPQERIQSDDEMPSLGGFIFLDDFPNLPQESQTVLFGRLDEQHVPMFADVLPQEIKTIADMDDAGFFR